MRRPNIAPAQLTLLLQWVGCTFLMGTVGLILADAPVVGMPAYVEDYGVLLPLLLWGCSLPVVVGLLVGVTQGWVLRRWHLLPNIGLWIIATTVGTLLSQMVLIGIALATGGEGSANAWLVVPGFVLGISQGNVLGRAESRMLDGRVTIWWILANGGGWLVAVVIGRWLFNFLVPPESDASLTAPFSPFDYAVAWGSAWALGAVVFGMITGLALLWLAQHPTPTDSSLRSE